MRAVSDHKYDPITHKEYYQFFAFFNSVPERGLDGRLGNAAPVLPLPSHAQQTRLDELDAAIEARTDALADAIVEPAQREWEKTLSHGAARSEPGTDALIAHYELDRNFSDISGRFQHGRMVTGDPTFEVGRVGRAVKFDGDTEVSWGTSARSIGRTGFRPPFGSGRAATSRCMCCRS